MKIILLIWMLNIFYKIVVYNKKIYFRLKQKYKNINFIFENITKNKNIINIKYKNNLKIYNKDINTSNIKHFIENYYNYNIIKLENKEDLLNVNKQYDRIYVICDNINHEFKQNILKLIEKYPFIHFYLYNKDNFINKVIYFKINRLLKELKNKYNLNEFYKDQFKTYNDLLKIYQELINFNKYTGLNYIIFKRHENYIMNNLLSPDFNLKFFWKDFNLNKHINFKEFYFLSWDLLSYFKINNIKFIVYLYSKNILNNLEKIQRIYYESKTNTPIVYLDSNSIYFYKYTIWIKFNYYNEEVLLLNQYINNSLLIINKTSNLYYFQQFEFKTFLTSNKINLITYVDIFNSKIVKSIDIIDKKLCYGENKFILNCFENCIKCKEIWILLKFKLKYSKIYKFYKFENFNNNLKNMIWFQCYRNNLKKIDLKKIDLKNVDIEKNLILN